MLLMKATSWSLHRKRYHIWWTFFFTTPLLSLRGKEFTTSEPLYLIIKFILIQIIMFNFVFFVAPFLYPLTWWSTIALSPIILFLTEAVGSLGELLAAAFGKKIHPIHEMPVVSKSLVDFWGKRWNRWVQDWLRDIGTLVRRKSLFTRLGFIFFFSGLFHEVMFNLPYWLVYRKSYFGTMMLYFLIQAAGLWLDKRVVYRAPLIVQRLYLWAVVLLPSPIFLNTPLLTFLGIKND
jgi:hypothetical protein